MAGAFVRTPAGLRNAHKFHAADYIIYCESHPDCAEGMSWDVGYWGKVLQTFFPNISYIFKPQGSKAGVLQIAEGLGHSRGHRSLCLVDKDFDDLHRGISEYPCVVYTHGYAFENDLCDADVISSAIDVSLPGHSSLLEIRKLVAERRDIFEAQTRWCVIADQILSFYFSSLFDRKSGKFRSIYNVAGANDLPTLSKPRVRERLLAQRGQIYQCRAVATPPPVDRDFWNRILGHLCWWINFRIARNILAIWGHSGRLSEDSFAGLCLYFFSHRLKDPNWVVRKHFEDKLIPALEWVS